MWHSCGGPEHNPSNFGHDSFVYKMHTHEPSINYYYNSTFTVKTDFKPLGDAMKYTAKANFWTSAMNNLFGLGAAALISRGNGGGGTSFLGNLLGGLAGGIGGGNYYGGSYANYGGGSLSSAPYTQFLPWQFNAPAANTPANNDNSAQNPNGDNTTQNPGNTGNAQNPGNTGDAQNPGNTGDAQNPGNTGNAQNPGNTGNAQNPGNTGNTQNPNNDGSAQNQNGGGDGKVKDSDLLFAANQKTDTDKNGILDKNDKAVEKTVTGVATGVGTHKATSGAGEAKIGAGTMTEAEFNALSADQKAALKKLGIDSFKDLTGKRVADGGGKENYPNTISFTADPTISTDGPGGTRKQSGGRWTFVFTGKLDDNGKPKYQYSEALSTVAGAYRKTGSEPVYSVTVVNGTIQFERKSGAPALTFGG